MIYLASPYTANVQVNFESTEQFVAAALQNGHMIYSPIVHNHALALKYKLPKDYEFWQKHNRAMLAKASQLWVLTLDGYKTSRGVQAEIVFAKQCEIPVTEVR
jgi:hypothetical protein